MKLLSTMLILFLSANAQAQLANLPDVAGYTKVGRVAVFKSVQPLSWLQPTAFSNELSCSTGATEYKTCSIKIFNHLNDDEKNQIDQLVQNDHLGIVSFSNIDSQVVGDIHEEFNVVPADLEGKVISLGTLQLSDGKMPYASYMFRVKADKANELMQKYASEGLGKYKVSFKLAAEKTDTYLSVTNGACLKEKLNATQNGLYKKQLNKQIGQMLTDCGLKSANYEPEEAIMEATINIRNKFFSFSLLRGYELKTAEVSNISKSYIMQNQSDKNITLQCHSELNLAAAAVVVTECDQLGN